jgi:hypothetical protein
MKSASPRNLGEGKHPTINPGTAKAPSTSRSTYPAPSGHAMRRSMAVDEAVQARRRPTLSQVSAADGNLDGERRRSSTFSDYGLYEARRSLQSGADDLLNPRLEGAKGRPRETSPWASLPLAFAVIPALGGLVFKNGNMVITDLILLALASIFLWWTVTQPW